MSEITKTQEAKDPQVIAASPVRIGTDMVAMIEKVAMNPDLPVEKLARLLDMQYSMMDRAAKTAYSEAMTELQNELPIIDPNKAVKVKGSIQSKYATFDKIMREIRPLLQKHGFSLSFRTQYEEGFVTVTAICTHVQGHQEETALPLPLDQSGNKNAVQTYASTVSYGKRYTASALLNIIVRGEDDDGNGGKDNRPEHVQVEDSDKGQENNEPGPDAAANKPATPFMLRTFRKRLEREGSDPEEVAKHYKVKSFDDLTTGMVNHAMSLMDKRKKEGE